MSATWVYITLAYLAGFLSTFVFLFFAGRYAFTHPKVMAPITRRMVRVAMRGGEDR